MDRAYIYIALFILLSTQILVAQSPDIISFDNHHDFPVKRINQIKQCKEGYIWIASAKGLFRYDGNKFKQIGKKAGIGDANIRALFIDKDSSIYVTSYAGHTWKLKNRDVHFQKPQKKIGYPGIPPVPHSYISINDTVSYINYKMQKLFFHGNQLVKTEKKDSIDLIYTLASNNSKKRTNKIALYLQLNLKKLMQHEKFMPGRISIYANQRKTIIINGNMLVEQENGKTKVSYPKHFLLSYGSVGKTELKGVYGKGLIIEDKKGIKDTLLHNCIISSIFTDKHLGVWIGTLNNGLYYIRNLHAKNFTTDNTSKGAINDIVKINDKIIIAYASGIISVYETKNETFTPRIQLTHCANSLQPLGNKKFIATCFRNISVLELQDDKIVLKKRIKNEADIFLKTAYFDHKIYTAGIKGIKTYNLNNDTWENHYLKEMRIRQLTSAGKNIYAANEHGVWKISRNTGAEKISDKAVEYLGFSDNTLFISHEKTLFGIQNKTDTIYQTKIPPSIKHVFKKDDQIIISTYAGAFHEIIKSGRRKKHEINYTSGLPNSKTDKTILDNHQLFVLCQSSLTILPFKQKKPRNTFSIHLSNKEAIKTGNSTYLLNLNEDSTHINLGFSTFDFASQESEKVLYYRLDKDTTSRKMPHNELAILNPDKGKMNIYVSNRKNFDDPENIIKVIIKKRAAWHEIIWIQVAGILIIVTMVTLIARMRLQSVKRKSKLENVRISQMQTILQQQMNPHFIFNSLTSINHFILQNKPMDSSRYLTKFSTLIRNILDNSKVHMIPLADEVVSLTIYLDLELLRFKNRFTYSFRINPDVDKNQLMVPPFILQPFVETALRERIMNNPKKGTLIIYFRILHKTLQCTIIDDGINQEENQYSNKKNNSRTKIGTHIAKQRIEVYNKLNVAKIYFSKGKIFNHKNEVVGSKIVLNFPLNYSKNVKSRNSR